MNLVYLVFGDNTTLHAQANFSILSFLSQKQILNKIIVLTDSPGFYNYLANENCIQIERISKETLNIWKGEYNFFWRVKIKALEHVYNHNPSHHILYLDADTFLFNNLNVLKQYLDTGHNIMHTNEGKLSRIKSKTTAKMFHQLREKEYSGILIDNSSCMWNAGVVGVSKHKSKDVLSQALDICDQMCREKVTSRLIEQFALSIVLNQENTLLSAENNIGHYWGNKEEWNKLIKHTILKFHFNEFTLKQQIDYIKSIDFTLFPVVVKVPNTRNRLISLITRLFANKYKTYIPSKKLDN